MKQPTQEDIRAARKRAEELDITSLADSKFRIDWTRTSPDSRHGNLYAWDEGGAFLGQFASHGRALEHGAAVSVMLPGNYWFVWRGTWEERPTEE
jgi:hypothetical protein